MSSYNGIYLMGNYPDPDTFVNAALKGLEFFDFLEVGIPFSDPVADGPVIVEAGAEVLEKGETIHSISESIDRIREKMPEGKKIYFMTYANIVHALGKDAFCLECKTHGVNGMILPDIPGLEAAPYREEAAKHGLEYVEFITPESTEDQIKETVKAASGFVYAVSVRGITGQNVSISDEIAEKISIARNNGEHPVVMGFGIKDVETAKAASMRADGFIMGTEPVRRIKKGFDEFSLLIDELKSM